MLRASSAVSHLVTVTVLPGLCFHCVVIGLAFHNQLTLSCDLQPSALVPPSCCCDQTFRQKPRREGRFILAQGWRPSPPGQEKAAGRIASAVKKPTPVDESVPAAWLLPSSHSAQGPIRTAHVQDGPSYLKELIKRAPHRWALYPGKLIGNQSFRTRSVRIQS